MMEKTTNAIAVGAVGSPWWVPSLSDVSQMAAELLPICGVVWLIVQIVTRITRK